MPRARCQCGHVFTVNAEDVTALSGLLTCCPNCNTVMQFPHIPAEATSMDLIRTKPQAAKEPPEPEFISAEEVLEDVEKIPPAGSRRRSTRQHSGPIPQAGPNQQIFIVNNYYGAADVPFECPFCCTDRLPTQRTRISMNGWVTAICMLFIFFPLFWIGLLITEPWFECSDCGSKLS